MNSFASSFRCKVTAVPRGPLVSASRTVKPVRPSEVQIQLLSSPALRLWTTTRSATMNAE